jgi:hypothetical protein
MELLAQSVGLGDLSLFVAVASRMRWDTVDRFEGASCLAWAATHCCRNGPTATRYMVEVLAKAGFRLLHSDLGDLINDSPECQAWVSVYTLYESRPEVLATIEFLRVWGRARARALARALARAQGGVPRFAGAAAPSRVPKSFGGTFERTRSVRSDATDAASASRC